MSNQGQRTCHADQHPFPSHFWLSRGDVFQPRPRHAPSCPRGLAWGLVLALFSSLGTIAPLGAQSIVPAADGTGTQVVPSSGPSSNESSLIIQGGTQAGHNLFHSFAAFGLSPNQIARFLTQPHIQNVLGRVTGGNVSIIDGILQVTGSNANLYLINPAGLVFGPNARLDLAGSFTATTATGLGFAGGEWTLLSTPNYAALTGDPSAFRFAAQPGSILNSGNLAVAAGQRLTLLGGTVITSGSLSAPGGEITILAVPGDRIVRLRHSGMALSLDLPTAPADAPPTAPLPFTPLTLPQLLTGGSLAHATAVMVHADGTISLNGSAAAVTATPGTALISGRLDTRSAGTGGEINLLGDRLALIQSTLDASGNQGGGTLRIGGDAQGRGALPSASLTTIDAGTRLQADAQVQGDGGRVIVWSDRTTRFYGRISARGGLQGGNGGFVETSGAIGLDLGGGSVDTGAPAGGAGTWLIDPSDITIASEDTTALGNPDFFSPLDSATLDVTTIIEALRNNNVTITTVGAGQGNGDIFLTVPINSEVAGRSLTLTSRFLIPANAATINLGTNSTLILNLNAVNPNPTPPANIVGTAIGAIGQVGSATISLGPGTYLESIQIGEIAPLTLQGAGAGNTLLSGNNTSRVIGVFGNSTLTLANLTLANGRAPQGESGGGIFNSGRLTLLNSVVRDNFADLDGGGIESFGPNAALTVRNTVIRDNVAAVDGGGIFSRGELEIQNSTLVDNQAGNSGGAVYNEGRFTLTNSLIENNRAAPLTGLGGGIANLNEATLNLVGSTLRNNAAYSGGGIYSSNSTALVDSSWIENNRSTLGGGITNDFGTLRIQNGTLITGNQATDSAGGLTNFNGIATLDTITIANNTANVSGGGVANNTNSTMTIVNSTVRGNQSTFGGGITNFNNAQLMITESVIDANIANQNGGGIDTARNSRLTLNDITLSNNTAQRGGSISSGENSTVVVTESLFTRNTAGDGGAIFNGITTTLTVGSSQFSENVTTFDGAGIYQLGEVVIQNSNFTNNQARDGAGIHQVSGNLTVNETLFDGNRATNAGGAIEADSSLGPGNLVIQRSRFFNNQAQLGGGIASFNANSINIVDTVFENNWATTSGGGVNNDRPVSLSITRSTFVNNRSEGQGGAIANYGSATLTNLTISGNSAGNQGGGVLNTGTLDLTQSTLTLNTANQGGGLRNLPLPGDPAVVRIGNSIVAGNQAIATAPDVSGRFTPQGSTLIGIADGSTGFTPGPLVGTAIAPLDPLLSPLGNYGGTTPSHALLPGSPAIDAGGSSPSSADQRGIARVGPVDLGSFESRGFVLSVAQGSEQTVLTNAPFTPLSVAIRSLAGEPVEGGQLTFRAPLTGARWSFLTDSITVPIIGGQATTAPTANATPGAFTITATLPGAIAPAFFNLFTAAPAAPAPPLLPAAPPAPARPDISQIRRVDPAPSPPLPETGRTALSFTVDESLLPWLDSFLSRDYLNYWGLPEHSGLTLAQIQEILRQAQQQKAITFAVIYAVFLPVQTNGSLAFDPLNPTAYLENHLTRQRVAPQDNDQLALVLILPTGQARLYPIGVTRRQVLPQAQLWRITSADPEDDASFKPLARQFHNWLLDPLEQDLQRLGVTDLIFALDQGLRTLPLAAMMAGDRYLIERYGVSVVPSLGLTDLRLAPLAPRTALLMGVEQFQQKAALPAVPTEIRTIASSLAIDELWLNERVTLSNLIQQETTRQPEILHLATHAVFNPGSPSDSYIQLWNEQLTLAEMRSLSWDLSNLSLLTLSACATALGSTEAELGFTGLAAATGVRSTLGSLWSVSDLGTLALMSELYGRLGSMAGVSQALRTAQLSLLRGETRLEDGALVTQQGKIPLPPALQQLEATQFTHPFYWSGFTLVGSPW